MTKQKRESPAIELLDVLWRNRQAETGHSWLRLNQSMHDGLMLAVRMGLRFDVGDLQQCFALFRMGYWIGDTGLEEFYRQAVLYGNSSAWKCLESHLNRKPFIVSGASLQAHSYGGGRMGGGLARLVVGAEFPWNGERVSVSSFRDGDKPHVVACSYHQSTHGERKVKHLYRISHADIKQGKRGAKCT